MDANATGHWKKRLSKLPADELFALRDQVTEVTKLPGWQRIVEEIEDAYMAIFRSMTIGPTRSAEGYARQTGYCAGLEEAPQFVKAVEQAATAREAQLGREADIDQQNRAQEASE